MSPLLFDGFATYETGSLSAVICGYNKVDTPVYAYNITDVRNTAFLNTVCYGNMQIILPLLIYKFGCAKLVNIMVKVF